MARGECQSSLVSILVKGEQHSLDEKSDTLQFPVSRLRLYDRVSLSHNAIALGRGTLSPSTPGPNIVG